MDPNYGFFRTCHKSKVCQKSENPVVPLVNSPSIPDQLPVTLKLPAFSFFENMMLKKSSLW